MYSKEDVLKIFDDLIDYMKENRNDNLGFNKGKERMGFNYALEDVKTFRGLVLDDTIKEFDYVKFV